MLVIFIPRRFEIILPMLNLIKEASPQKLIILLTLKIGVVNLQEFINNNSF